MVKGKKPKRHKKGIDLTLLAILIAVIVLIGSVSGWYLYNLQTKNGGGAQQTEKQKLLMGTSADFPPFEFVNSTTNEIEGFDIDIARKIADVMNRTLVIRDIAFDGLIPALQAGNVDMVIAGMTITEQRKLAVDFSEPYFGGNQTAVVHKDTTNINSVSDLNGKKIAVQLGTTGDLWVSNTSNVQNAQIKRFSKFTEALLELEQKHVDAVVMDQAPAESYVALKTTLKVAFNIHTEEKYGIAVKKGNTSLLDNINRILDDMIKSGEYDQLYKKWFG